MSIELSQSTSSPLLIPDTATVRVSYIDEAGDVHTVFIPRHTFEAQAAKKHAEHPSTL